MSPVRACTRHGRPKCPECARHARQRAQGARRTYSDTAAYRAMILAVLEYHGPGCPYCPFDTTDDDRVLAHYPTPHADGGPFVLENLRAAHKLCNLRAGRRAA